MRVSRMWAVAFVCLSPFCLWISAVGQPSDQVVAERVLGPQWRRISRQAGMIFAGTIIGGRPQAAATDRTTPGPQLTLRVDEAIAGVETGQTVSIREWAGTASMNRHMLSGQHVLFFLYPPSRIGLTSPVSGSLGQVALDASGRFAAQHPNKSVPFKNRAQPLPTQASQQQTSSRAMKVEVAPISITQLERAIHSAREE